MRPRVPEGPDTLPGLAVDLVVMRGLVVCRLGADRQRVGSHRIAVQERVHPVGELVEIWLAGDEHVADGDLCLFRRRRCWKFDRLVEPAPAGVLWDRLPLGHGLTIDKNLCPLTGDTAVEPASQHDALIGRVDRHGELAMPSEGPAIIGDPLGLFDFPRPHKDGAIAIDGDRVRGNGEALTTGEIVSARDERRVLRNDHPGRRHHGPRLLGPAGRRQPRRHER